MAVFSEENQVTIVATYSPSGNKMNEYMTNVVAFADRRDDPLSSWGTKKRRTSLSFRDSERVV